MVLAYSESVKFTILRRQQRRQRESGLKQVTEIYVWISSRAISALTNSYMLGRSRCIVLKSVVLKSESEKNFTAELEF